MFPRQDMIPPATASSNPLREAPRNATRAETVSGTRIGSNPRVESAWLCSAERELPSSLDATAQTPQQRRATKAQVNQVLICDQTAVSYVEETHLMLQLQLSSLARWWLAAFYSERFLSSQVARSTTGISALQDSL